MEDDTRVHYYHLVGLGREGKVYKKWRGLDEYIIPSVAKVLKGMRNNLLSYGRHPVEKDAACRMKLETMISP